MSPTSEPPKSRAYQRIADDLRREILEGTLAPGARVPAQSELAKRYSVAKGTAERATELLLREQLIVSRPGAGAFVADRSGVVRWVRTWYSQPGAGSPWKAAMAAIGREGSWTSSTTVVDAVPAVAQRLNLDHGEQVVRTDYVYLLDGAPAFLATSWEPLALTDRTPIMLPEAGPYAGAGVRDRMAAIGHTPTRRTEEPVAHVLTVVEAEKLGLHPGMAVIRTQRTYFEGDHPLETADIILPPGIRTVHEGPVD